METELKPLVNGVSLTCTKYLTTCNGIKAILSKLENLDAQQRATNTVGNSHALKLAHPNAVFLLTRKLEFSIQEELENLNTKMDQLKVLRDQLRKWYIKSMKLRGDTYQTDQELPVSHRTELHPSLTDILLWVESIFRVTNEDYESRKLHMKTGIPANNLENLIELSNASDSTKQIEGFAKEFNCFCWYFLDK